MLPIHVASDRSADDDINPVVEVIEVSDDEDKIPEVADDKDDLPKVSDDDDEDERSKISDDSSTPNIPEYRPKKAKKKVKLQLFDDPLFQPNPRSKIPKLHQCQKCKKSYLLYLTREKHQTMAEYLCKNCDTQQTSKPATGGSQPKFYLCDICGLNFADQTIWKEHQVVHQGKNRSNFKCPICPKEFPKLSSWRRHCHWHDNHYYICDECSARFTTPQLWATHYLSKHC